MAYNSQNNGGYRGSSNGFRQDNKRGYDSNKNYQKKEIEVPTPKPLPSDYVDKAENVMKTLQSNRNQITTTKIRSILAMVSEIYNEESRRNDEKLSDDSMANIQLLRVRMIYECGRNPSDVKPFIEDSKLIDYLLGIGDNRQKFINYAHYVEALVAYHRYFGGKN